MQDTSTDSVMTLRGPENLKSRQGAFKNPIFLQLALTEHRFIFGFRVFLIVTNGLEMPLQMLKETFE